MTHLFIANVLGREGDGTFHGQKAENLEEIYKILFSCNVWVLKTK
jgi:hypothetical protein